MNQLRNQVEDTLIRGIKALYHVRDENDKKIKDLEAANDAIFEKLTSIWLAQANLVIAAKQTIFAVYEFYDTAHPIVLAGVFFTRTEAQKRATHIERTEEHSTCTIKEETANETHLNHLTDYFMNVEY